MILLHHAIIMNLLCDVIIMTIHDHLSKAALNITSNQDSKIPYTDLKHKIKKIMMQKWQQLWDKTPTTSSTKWNPL